jgi:hypothetical protein
MIDHLMLTDKEAELLLEVLDAHRQHLLPEIRRTDGRRMRGDLQRRLRTFDRIIERLRHPEDEPAAVPAGAARARKEQSGSPV